MRDFNKLLISKIISIAISLVFFINTSAHGIDLSTKSYLRAPLMGNSNAGEKRLGAAASEVKKTGERTPAAHVQEKVNATQKDAEPIGRTTISLQERLKPVLTASFIALPVAHIIASALFFIAPGSIATIISGISIVVLTAAYIVADSTYKFSDYSAIPLVRKGYKLVDKLIINKVIPPAIWIGAFGYAAYFLFQWNSVNNINEMTTFWQVARVATGSFVAVGIGALLAGWVGIFVKAIPEIIIDFLSWRVRNMLEKREEGRRYNSMPQDSLSKLTKRQANYIRSIGDPAIEEFFHRFIVVNSWMYIGSNIFGLNYPLSIIVTLVVSAHYFWATHRPNQYATHLSSGLGYSALYLAASYFLGPIIGFIAPLAAHFTHNTWMMSGPGDSIFDRDVSSRETQAPLASNTEFEKEAWKEVADELIAKYKKDGSEAQTPLTSDTGHEGAKEREGVKESEREFGQAMHDLAQIVTDAEEIIKKEDDQAAVELLLSDLNTKAIKIIDELHKSYYIFRDLGMFDASPNMFRDNFYATLMSLALSFPLKMGIRTGDMHSLVDSEILGAPQEEVWRALSKHKTTMDEKILKRVRLGIPVVVEPLKTVKKLKWLQKKIGNSEIDFSIVYPPGAPYPLVIIIGGVEDKAMSYLHSFLSSSGHTHGFSTPLEVSPSDIASAEEFGTDGASSFVFALDHNDRAELAFYKPGFFDFVYERDQSKISKKLRELHLLASQRPSLREKIIKPSKETRRSN